MDALAVIAIIGGILLCAGLLREFKVGEITIPPLPRSLRILSASIGGILILIVIVIWISSQSEIRLTLSATPTATNIPIPTDTPTTSSTATPTNTPNSTPSSTPTVSPTATPTDTPSPPTDTPTVSPTATATNTPTPAPTYTPSPSPTPTQTPIPPTPTETPIPSVRLDAVAIPAGWMTGSQGSGPESFITLGPSQVACYTGSDCIQISYKPGGGWGGIFWWPQSCGPSGTSDAWKKVKDGTCGTNVLAAGNLNTVNSLTFWARGNQGREVIEFKIGAEDIIPKSGRSLGNVTLTNTWTQYKIGLQGMDLTNAIGLFAWIATDLNNSQETIFYLDDIQFEGMR